MRKPLLGRSLRRKSLGQSMVEYTIVTAAFVTGLLVVNDGACPNEYEDCVEYLLTVMHDNADGYSNSITAVQDYGPSLPVSHGPDWGEEVIGPPPGGGGGGGGGEPIPELGIGQSTQVTSTDGTAYGVLDGNQVVDSDGNVIGTYSSATGDFTSTDGVVVAVLTRQVVTDEAGNVLQMQAAVDCTTGTVHGFGYKSKVSDKFVTSLTMNEADISDYCLAPAYGVVTRNGSADGGSIVNGFYYPVSFTAVLTPQPLAPAGEVVYWSDLNDCVAMAIGWDAGIDPELSDEDRYLEQVRLYEDQNPGTSPYIGRLSSSNYNEHRMDGAGAWPNDCVSVRTVSEP